MSLRLSSTHAVLASVFVMLAEVFFAFALWSTTFAEPLWRLVCSKTSEYHMFVWGCFFSQIFGYFLGCVPYLIMDLRRGKTVASMKVQASIYPTITDILHASSAMLVSFVTVVLPMLLVGGFVINTVGITRDGPIPSWSVVAIQITFFFLVEDYLNYWLHRLLHLPWLYNNIHAVHHKYNAPFSIMAAYAHPLEVIILAIPTFAGPALIGPHLYTLMIWQMMRNYEAIDIHSGYELPLTFKSFLPGYAGTDHHDYHHYMHSGNFASVFTWCDRLYGTHLGYQSFLEKRKTTKDA